jgi:hypothetical protein
MSVVFCSWICSVAMDVLLYLKQRLGSIGGPSRAAQVIENIEFA